MEFEQETKTAPMNEEVSEPHPRENVATEGASHSEASSDTNIKSRNIQDAWDLVNGLRQRI